MGRDPAFAARKRGADRLPSAVRLRKRHLDPHERKRHARRGGESEAA